MRLSRMFGFRHFTRRTLVHLLLPRWWVLRVFSRADLAAITAAVTAAETAHRGELRVVIEGPLPLGALRRNIPPRARALGLFGTLGVNRTRERSGIMIYLQLVDRRVEILADHGIAAKVPQQDWDAICRGMEAAFRAGHWRQGTLDAVERAGALLATHFPVERNRANELPDAPLLL